MVLELNVVAELCITSSEPVEPGTTTEVNSAVELVPVAKGNCNS